MSAFDTEDRGVRGYFLPEDSQAQLLKLHEHMETLSRKAAPRAGDEAVDGPVMEPPAIAGSLVLLAELLQRVLDTVSWPARMEAGGRPTAAEDEAGEVQAAAAVDADAVDGVGAYGTGTPAAEVGDDYLFGVTLDQVDDLNRHLQMLKAQGDLLMASTGADLAEDTLNVTGTSVFNGADEVYDIVQEITNQPLDAARRAPLRVREAAAVYGVVATPVSVREASSLH